MSSVSHQVLVHLAHEVAVSQSHTECIQTFAHILSSGTAQASINLDIDQVWDEHLLVRLNKFENFVEISFAFFSCMQHGSVATGHKRVACTVGCGFKNLIA